MLLGDLMCAAEGAVFRDGVLCEAILASNFSLFQSRLPCNNIQLSRTEAISLLVSDTFREALQEVPAAAERSQRLKVVAKALCEDSRRDQSLSSLYHSIRFAPLSAVL